MYAILFLLFNNYLKKKKVINNGNFLQGSEIELNYKLEEVKNIFFKLISKKKMIFHEEV